MRIEEMNKEMVLALSEARESGKNDCIDSIIKSFNELSRSYPNMVIKVSQISEFLLKVKEGSK